MLNLTDEEWRRVRGAAGTQRMSDFARDVLLGKTSAIGPRRRR